MTEPARAIEPNPQDMRRKLTKQRRKEICREIIDRCPIGAEFPADDLALFNEMLGTSFVAAKHMRNTHPNHRNDPRHVHVFDGAAWDVCGWNNYIYPKTDWRRLCDVFRKLSADQAKKYLSETGETECAYAHKGGCNGPLQADHAGMPFDDIAKAFVAEFGTPELIDGPPGAGKILKDTDMEANWIGFHASRVVWQLLCRSHNASKGKRGDKQ